MSGNNEKAYEKNSDGKSGDSRSKDNSFQGEENSIESYGFIKQAVIGDYEITVNGRKLKNPIEIIEKLCPLKDNETLTNDEKIEQVQKIINEYME